VQSAVDIDMAMPASFAIAALLLVCAGLAARLPSDIFTAKPIAEGH
jgi:hypothetical protein